MKKTIALLAAAGVLCASLSACTSTKTYTSYVQSILDASYRGEFTEYMDLTDSTQEEAQAIYDDEVTYVTSLICYHLGVEEDYITEGTMTGYEAIAKDLLGTLEYTVDEAVKAGDAYHVTVHVCPTTFWDVMLDKTEAFYTDEFAEYYNDVLENGTEAELEAAEEEYAVAILDIVSENMASVGSKESVEKIVKIVEDDTSYGVSDQDWLDIDDLLLDLNPNT